jgi:hypothetical protein
MVAAGLSHLCFLVDARVCHLPTLAVLLLLLLRVLRYHRL